MIPESIGFSTNFVANHDAFPCFPGKFGVLGFRDVSISRIAGRSKGGDDRFGLRPGLFKSGVWKM